MILLRKRELAALLKLCCNCISYVSIPHGALVLSAFCHWGFLVILTYMYSKPCLKEPLKSRPQRLVFKTDYHLMRAKVLQNVLKEHSAILSTCIKVDLSFRDFVFEWLLKTGVTVLLLPKNQECVFV